MADLQSMTLQERMITILNAEHSLSYGIYDLSFQEACNKWLIETGTVNGVSYSGISINKYTPEEVFAIIRHKIDLRSETLGELVSELGSYYPIHKYTATEALNKKNAVLAPYSLSFNGSSYVDCGAPNQAQNVTISVWVRPSQVSTYAGVCGSAGDDGYDGYRLGISNSAKIDALIGDTDSYNLTIGDTSIVINTWNHLVMTADDNFVKVYLNGVNDNASPTARTDTTTFDDNLIIGAWGDLTYKYSGKIDEVSIFNRALTQAEITSLYAANPQNAGDAVGITNLVGYWKFDEGTGEPQDTSGNGNHGAITSATWTVH